MNLPQRGGVIMNTNSREKYKLVVSQVKNNEIIPKAEFYMGSLRRLELAYETIQDYHNYNKEYLLETEDWLIDMYINEDLYGDPVVTNREFGEFLVYKVNNIWSDLDKFVPIKAKRG
jgi:hypothetical protein